MIYMITSSISKLSLFLFEYNWGFDGNFLEPLIMSVLWVYIFVGIYLFIKQLRQGVDRRKLLFMVTRAELIYSIVGFSLGLLHQFIRPTSLFLVGLFGLGLAYNAILLMIKIHKEGKYL